MRLEVAQFDIDVVIIEPGVIKTEFGNATLAPMIERSSNSAYLPIAKKLEEMVKNYQQPGNASNPAVIAKIVFQVIKAKKPKTRYVAGKYAKPLIIMRKFLNDRIFDKIIMSSY